MVTYSIIKPQPTSTNTGKAYHIAVVVYEVDDNSLVCKQHTYRPKTGKWTVKRVSIPSHFRNAQVTTASKLIADISTVQHFVGFSDYYFFSTFQEAFIVKLFLLHCLQSKFNAHLETFKQTVQTTIGPYQNDINTMFQNYPEYFV